MSYPPPSLPYLSFPTKRKTSQKQETNPTTSRASFPFLSPVHILDPTTQTPPDSCTCSFYTHPPPPPLLPHSQFSLPFLRIHPGIGVSRPTLSLTAQYPLVNFMISRVSHTSLTPQNSAPFAPFAQPSGPSCRFLSRFSFFLLCVIVL